MTQGSIIFATDTLSSYL